MGCIFRWCFDVEFFLGGVFFFEWFLGIYEFITAMCVPTNGEICVEHALGIKIKANYDI